MTAADLAESFRKEFHVEPQIYTAPGRVNLIGEHTDYNDGFVLPCAIGFFTRVGIALRSDGKLVLRSAEYEQLFEFDVSNLPRKPLSEWCDYVLGVATMLCQDGLLLLDANLFLCAFIQIRAWNSSSAA